MKQQVLVILLFLSIIIGGCTQKMGQTQVTIETTMGVMKVELYDDLAPITTGNFKKLVQEGFYDNTRFHRVIAGFMIQGGDPLSKDTGKKIMWGTGGPGYTINDEFVKELRHDKKGLLSMANAGPNTGGSQFFITLAPTPHLDDKHAIFGHVVGGEDVLDKIGSTPTNQADQPVTDVVITKMSVA
jgi:cyclophilin family peptidyl-prolyl cis-trans isomerase